MASSVCWNFTELPLDIIDILDRDIQKFDASVQPSRLKGDIQNSFVRNSQNTWIPTSHWMSGWLWYYVLSLIHI